MSESFEIGTATIRVDHKGEPYDKSRYLTTLTKRVAVYKNSLLTDEGRVLVGSEEDWERIGGPWPSGAFLVAAPESIGPSVELQEKYPELFE